ncbi:MAG: hypothetical protein GX329_06490 [Tissierellia bacterium]|nr:hypothetical protein [Tissierellia bacterium]
MIKPRIYGAKGKVCMVGGAPGISDFHRWLHPEIGIASAPLPLDTLSSDGLMDMGKRVMELFEVHKKYEPSDLAFFSCTAGSLIGGPGYDQQLIESIKEAAGTEEAYTTTTAVLQAFKELGSKKISIITPYPDDVNEQEQAFFDKIGFTVNNIDGIVTEDPRNNKFIRKISHEEAYDFAVKHVDPKSDTLFISCTALGVLEIIADLEERLSIPVVTSNQAAAWRIGKYFGIHSDNALQSLGQLFKI